MSMKKHISNRKKRKAHPESETLYKTCQVSKVDVHSKLQWLNNSLNSPPTLPIVAINIKSQFGKSEIENQVVSKDFKSALALANFSENYLHHGSAKNNRSSFLEQGRETTKTEVDSVSACKLILGKISNEVKTEVKVKLVHVRVCPYTAKLIVSQGI